MPCSLYLSLARPVRGECGHMQPLCWSAQQQGKGGWLPAVLFFPSPGSLRGPRYLCLRAPSSPVPLICYPFISCPCISHPLICLDMWPVLQSPYSICCGLTIPPDFPAPRGYDRVAGCASKLSLASLRRCGEGQGLKATTLSILDTVSVGASRVMASAHSLS